MHKKNLIIFVLLLIAVGLVIYPRLAKQEAVASVSAVTANPEKFLGKLTLTGVVATVFPEENVFVIADSSACCQIPVLVPFTSGQQALLELNTLYTGALPQEGEEVTVSGTLKKEQGYYLLDVEQVARGGQVIINKVK